MKLRNILFLFTVAALTTQSVQPTDSFKEKEKEKKEDNLLPPIVGYEDFFPVASSTPPAPFYSTPLNPDAAPFKLEAETSETHLGKTDFFTPGDRNLNTNGGRDHFNGAVRTGILTSSNKSDKSYTQEITRLSQYAKTSADHSIKTGKIKILKNSAHGNTIHFKLDRIFTPYIKKTHLEKDLPQQFLLNGLYHDYKNTIEDAGIFQFNHKHNHGLGFYSADIAIDPENPDLTFHKNFFPADWSRKQVVDCILLSMNDVAKVFHFEPKDDSRIYIFRTPLQYIDGKSIITLDINLILTIKVNSKTKKTTLVCAYPELPIA